MFHNFLFLLFGYIYIGLLYIVVVRNQLNASNTGDETDVLITYYFAMREAAKQYVGDVILLF